MPPRADAAKHLTEKGLADRWGVDPVVVARKRRNGTGPKPLVVSDSATKKTIRYRLAEVEAWEDEHLAETA